MRDSRTPDEKIIDLDLRYSALRTIVVRLLCHTASAGSNPEAFLRAFADDADNVHLDAVSRADSIGIDRDFLQGMADVGWTETYEVIQQARETLGIPGNPPRPTLVRPT